jgi:hypothetical protein
MLFMRWYERVKDGVVGKPLLWTHGDDFVKKKKRLIPPIETQDKFLS